MYQKYKKLEKKFNKYFEDNDLSRKDFSKMVYLAPEYMRQIVKGYKKPSQRIKKIIIEKTNGFIQMEDFD